MTWLPRRVAAGMAAAVTCTGVLASSAPVDAAQRQPAFLQVIAHPDDDLLFMSPDLSGDLRTGGGVTTVVLTAGEGHAGIKPDTHDPLAYVTERRQGLRAAYAAMADVPDIWRIEAVWSGRTRIEVHTLVGRPNIHLAFLSLPDGRDPRAGLGRRALAQLIADRGSRKCARTVTPQGSPYASCLTHRDVLDALRTLLRRSGATVVRSQDPEPDKRYTPDHTDHIAAAGFAAEAVQAYGRRLVEVSYRDYNLTDTPVNLDAAARTAKQRIFAGYRAHDYRINPESANFASWQERMRYRWPRGTSWAAGMPDGRAFAVLSGHLYGWWQTPSGWAGPAPLGGDSLAPSLAVAGGQVFALDGSRVVAARPLLTGGEWSVTWTTIGGGAVGAPVAATDDTGRTAVFMRDAEGGVSVKCQAAGGPWPKRWLALRALDRQSARRPRAAAVSRADTRSRPRVPARRRALPPDRDIQDGMNVVGGAGTELFAPTRTGVLQWRQTSGCGFAYAGAVPGVRPAGPLTAVRDSDGRPALVYEEGESAAVRQVTETGRTWSAPASPLGAVFRAPGEAPVPTGSSVSPPAVGVPVVGVPVVVTDATGKASALALGADGRMYASARGLGNMFGAWRPAG